MVRALQERSLRHAMLRLGLVVGIAAVTVLGLPATTKTVQAADPACPWMDPFKSPDERARLLLGASTLDQKLRWLDEQSANNPTQTVFSIGGGQTVTMPPQVACTPVIQYTDGPAAISGGGTGITAFPGHTAMSATWDPALARRKGKALGYEAFHKHRNVILGPGLASGRDPRSGRTSEYLGEEPVLAGVMAGAILRGYGDNPAEPVEGVIKHYVANEQEIDRQRSSSNVDQRTLRQIYTLPFEIAIKEGDPGGVMCPFNQVNGVYGCANANILRQILKTEVGFEGWVVTDFGSVHSLLSNPPSLIAGMDQELNRWRFWNPNLLKDALAAGTITLADIDDAAFRVVRGHIANGLFDVPLPPVAEAVVTTPAAQAVAREVAEQGSVLLKNAGILPLAGSGKRIAVIGPTASSTPTNGISAASVCAYTAPGVPCTPKAPLDAITARAAQGGSTVVFNDGSNLASVAATAAAADVAIVFGFYRMGEFNDRPNLSLENGGDALVAAVAAANPNTVVVLQTGGPALMPWLGQVKAVLEGWYAGQEMGPAIASLLWGDVNPSGKLTHSFPRSEADLPTAGSPRQYPGVFADGSTTRPPGSTEIRQVDYLEGLQVGYRWYDAQGIEPLFPFGYGLSYTTFAYDKLSVTPASSDGTGKIRIRFRLSNTGSRTGSEVVQVYVGLPASTGEPPKRLVDFEKVTIHAGKTREIELQLNAQELKQQHLLQYWDTATKRWTTPTGTFTVSVGSSSRDLPLQGSFTVR